MISLSAPNNWYVLPTLTSLRAIFHLRLAMVCARTGQLDDARKEAKKATELAPDNEECRRFLDELEAKK